CARGGFRWLLPYYYAMDYW
nr:immunoglobulin heavy chain junction region [Mus musculus]MBK4197488.1 immunoglobulin heavy chain junction region [Mus musculus]